MSPFAPTLSLALREACANRVTQAIYARHGPALERFGDSGRRACREDVLHHLDYLDTAMNLGTSDPMVQYVTWLKTVLSERGVPVAHLAESLQLLEAFLGETLAGADLEAVRACLSPAVEALNSLSFAVEYGVMRVAPLEQAPDYQTFILAGNRRSALSCVSEAMERGASLTQACVQIIQPAMYHVGHLWQHNKISVSQEHLASAISQNVLVGAYMKADFLPANGKTAVFACVEGNYHALGLRVLSDAFETRGWDVAFLGPNLPTQDLLRDVDRRRPALLALSASLPGHLSTAKKTIEALRAEMGNACPEVWVGGVATQGDSGVWRYTQADGWASDALQALEQI